MAWNTTSGRDISHHNTISDYAVARAATDWVQIKLTEGTAYNDPAALQHYRGFAGKPRGGYHFARPVSIPDQIGWYLRRKREIGQFERPDMLDCEFDGVNGDFIRRLVAEYRRQSGTALVLVYAGLSLLTHACDPAGWWDPNSPIWAARYRKIGPPISPDSWTDHLGWNHPGLAIYQYDNATELPGGTTTDINIQRTALTVQEDDMVDVWTEEIEHPHVADPKNPGHGVKGQAKDVLWETNTAAGRAAADTAVVRVQLAALSQTLSDDEANVIAALHGQTGAGATAQEIAAALAPLLPPGATPDEIADAVRAGFAHHLATAPTT